MLVYREEFGYTLHALGCLYMFSNCLHPFMQFYGCLFLLYEFSTPFLHVRSFLLEMKKTETRTFAISQLLFALSFFLVRIVIGWPTLIGWASETIAVLRAGTHSQPLLIMYLVFGFSLNILNIYWFYLIARRALKSRKPAAKST